MQGLSAVPVSVNDVLKRYGRRTVLDKVSLQVPTGITGLVGPNGAGKSTLLKAALGLVPLVGGNVLLFGEPLRQVRKRVGYVPQRETVDWDFPVSVMDVVLMGTYSRVGWFRWPRKSERQLAEQCLERVGLADLARRQIGRLSGGQQQRVFLARALAQQADMYLLDEPMAGVDARSQEQILQVLAELRDRGNLVVVVHHDLRMVREWFDAVALIDRRLVAAGPTQETLSRENVQRTYSGAVDIFDEVGHAVKRRSRTL